MVLPTARKIWTVSMLNDICLCIENLSLDNVAMLTNKHEIG